MEENQNNENNEENRTQKIFGSNESKKEDSFTFKKSSMWKVATVVFAILFVVSLYTGGFGGDGITGGTVIDTGNQPSVLPPTGVKTANAKTLMDDDAMKGDKNAPLTIVEWSDFECSFCARFYDQTLAQIEEEYIKTGKVNLVYRDFPLSNIHPQAQKAAEAAECAGEQGKFFEMHDKLFEDGVEGGVNTFKSYAKILGLDTDDFDKCLDSGEMANEVSNDLKDGSSVGITGTPGFIVGTQKISGAQPFSVFQTAIEAQL